MEQNEHIEDFDKLIHAFIRIGNGMTGVVISKEGESLYNAEGLGKKILHHVVTSRVLLNGYQLEPYYPQIDFASIAILTRAALETYLTLNYLFIAPMNEDEKEFRLQAWYLGGLDRIKFEPAFVDSKEKYEHEIKLAAKIKQKIEATNFYKRLKPDSQKRILRGEWRYLGWPQIAQASGLDEKYFRQIYSWLCAYAHSNRWSIIQIQQSQKLNDQRKMAESFILILMIILGKYGYDYVNIMPHLKNKVDINSEDFKILLEYKIIAESLKFKEE